MVTKDNAQIETAEELEAEKEHLADIKEDQIRESVIKEYGFDPEADKERIAKAVEREMGYKKSISTAIGQKVKYRTKLGELSEKPPENKSQDTSDVNAIIDKRLEQERLDDMEYPDDIKAVIKSVAEINKISVKKAVSDPYVASRIEKWKKDSGADEAAAGRKNQGGGKGSSDEEIPDFDLTTEEGRTGWDNWKKGEIAKGH